MKHWLELCLPIMLTRTVVVFLALAVLGPLLGAASLGSGPRDFTSGESLPYGLLPGELAGRSLTVHDNLAACAEATAAMVAAGKLEAVAEAARLAAAAEARLAHLRSLLAAGREEEALDLSFALSSAARNAAAAAVAGAAAATFDDVVTGISAGACHAALFSDEPFVGMASVFTLHADPIDRAAPGARPVVRARATRSRGWEQHAHARSFLLCMQSGRTMSGRGTRAILLTPRLGAYNFNQICLAWINGTCGFLGAVNDRVHCTFLRWR